MAISLKQLDITGNITNTMIASDAAIAITKLAQKSVTINGTAIDLGQSLTLSTADIGESGNLYFTDARARGALSLASVTGPDVQLLQYNSTSGVFSVELSDIFAQLSAGAGLAWDGGGEFSLSADTDDVSEGASNLYFTDARARAALAVTDAGGDGSLVYNDSTGEFTFTGPSAAEVRAHISAGTGVAIVDGEIAIGQAVETTSNVEFNNMELNGYLRGPATFTIDPAAHGDDTGTLVVAGNLTVQGTTTTVDSNTVNIGDAILTLNADEAGAPSQNGGLEIERGTEANVQLVFNEGSDVWQFSQWDGNAWQMANLVSVYDFRAADGLTYDDDGEFGVDLLTNGGLAIDATTKGIKVLAKNAVEVDGSDGSLQVKLDGSTLAQSASGLKLADGAVDTNKLAADAVTDAKIADDAVHKEHLHSDVIKTQAGLVQETDGSLAVAIDNATVGLTAGGALEVKADSIGAAQMTVEKGAHLVSSPAASGAYNIDPSPAISYDNAQAGQPLTMVFLNGVKLFVGTGSATLGTDGVEAVFANNAGDLRIQIDASLLSDGDGVEFIIQS